MTRKIFATLCFAFIQSVIAGDKLIEEMLATYEANQARFHTNHRDHLLSGVGTVKKITSDFMGTGSYFKVILDVNGSTIQCSTKNKNMAAKLDKEQIVNFKGTIYDVILNSLIVENCQFTDYTPAVSNRSDDNRDDSLPLKNNNYNGYIYFAADKPPAEKDAPPESPLCYKFKVASIEEQLDKLQKKYGKNLEGEIQQEYDSSKVLTAKLISENGKTVFYKYFTSPSDCSDYQSVGNGGRLASKKNNEQIICDDFIKNGEFSDSYSADVQYLGKLAGLHYVSRYDSEIVNYLCTNDVEGLYQLYDLGYVSIHTINSFKEFLGLSSFYINPIRSKEGIAYESAYNKLIQMGLCTACASGPAQEYAKNTDSICAKLVQKALRGDQNAFKTLDSNSSPCE